MVALVEQVEQTEALWTDEYMLEKQPRVPSYIAGSSDCRRQRTRLWVLSAGTLALN
jgi:hypothetical protein